MNDEQMNDIVQYATQQVIGDREVVTVEEANLITMIVVEILTTSRKGEQS